MKTIYISGAYRGKTENEVFENIIHARAAARRLWMDGWCVVCPHLNSAFMETGEDDAKLFLRGGIELLRRCDAIYLLNNWERSEGARREYEEAKRLGLRILIED